MCEKCKQRGAWNNHRITFPETNADLRTDPSFDEMQHEDHHHGRSSLHQLVIRMVSQLRRFALAFIHSHSGATSVFRNAFMGKVAEATSCLPKTLQTT